MIKFRCAHCQQKLGVPDEYAGRRVRCSKCSQPNVVPAAQSPPASAAEQANDDAAPQAAGAPSAAETPIQLDFDSTPPKPEAENLFADLAGMEVVQEDPNLDAVRAARQEAAAKRTSAMRTTKKTKAAKPGSSSRASSERAAIADMVPASLHLPLALVLGVLAAAAMVIVWVIVARTTERSWGIFALLVAAAGAGGLRIFAVNRNLLWGMLGTALAAAAIICGKAAIAKHVVIPIYEKQANEECLLELDALLKDEDLQIPQSRSAKSFATDSDFLTCVALISLVDDGQADPVKVRDWSLHILRVSKKTNIFAFLADAGTHSYESTIPELDAEGEAVFAKAYQRMDEWDENETALRNTRKYFPALARLSDQCELLRMLEDPGQTFQWALIDTVGVLDVVWILLGMGFSYISLALD